MPPCSMKAFNSSMSMVACFLINSLRCLSEMPPNSCSKCSRNSFVLNGTTASRDHTNRFISLSNKSVLTRESDVEVEEFILERLVFFGFKEKIKKISKYEMEN